MPASRLLVLATYITNNVSCVFKLITSQTSSATLLEEEEEEGEHDAVQAAVAAERCCKKALAERLPVACDSVTSVEQTDTHTRNAQCKMK